MVGTSDPATGQFGWPFTTGRADDSRRPQEPLTGRRTAPAGTCKRGGASRSKGGGQLTTRAASAWLEGRAHAQSEGAHCYSMDQATGVSPRGAITEAHTIGPGEPVA